MNNDEAPGYTVRRETKEVHQYSINDLFDRLGLVMPEKGNIHIQVVGPPSGLVIVISTKEDIIP